jgi:histone arginine demethylase JMJD6
MVGLLTSKMNHADFFKLAGEHRRPPYRWFLIGPQRSGTGVHVDPLNTSAWNTLIKGRKRWVLFPPHLSKETVKGRKYVRKDLGEDDEPIDYFTKVLPRIKDAGGPDFVRLPPQTCFHCCAVPPASYRLLVLQVAEMMEFTQYPGETIFVPGGWCVPSLNPL